MRACRGKRSSAALAAGPLTGPVQAVLSRALNLLWEVPGLSGQHRELHRLWSYSAQSPIFVVDRLLTAMVTHQIWQARLCIRRPVCMEDYPRTYALILDCSEHIFSLALMSVDDVSDYIMHLCPIAVSRHTIILTMMMSHQ